MKITKIKKTHSIWFTGYPSSGKTTIAKLLLKKLNSLKVPAVNFDGDEIRDLLSQKKFDKNSRLNSVKSYIKLTKIIMNSKIIVIVSANHAFKQQRRMARDTFRTKYSEIWIDTPLEICKKRDVKNLFSKAKKGKLKNLVGSDLKFDEPTNYDLKINTLVNSKKKCVNIIIDYLTSKKIF